MEVLTPEQIDNILKSVKRETPTVEPRELTPEEQEEREKNRIFFRNFSNVLENINLKRGIKNCLPFSNDISSEVVHLEKIKMYEILNAMPDHSILVSFKVEPLMGHCIVDVPEEVYKEIIRQNYIDCETIDINLSVKDILTNILTELLKTFSLMDGKTNFVISDIDIKSPRFTPFPSEELVITSIFDIQITSENYQTLSFIVPTCMLDNFAEFLESEKLISNWFYE